MFSKRKIVVKEFKNPQNEKTEMALLVFNGKMRDSIISKFNQNFQIKGEYIKNGGVSSPATILSLLGASGGSLGISSAMSGNLFMATANPATLMSIGNGVGSAVIGAGGKIVAHAPFIPAAGAIMPVVAPLIAFQAISTIAIMSQFKAVNQKLDKLQDSVTTILQRQEATYVGEIISAFNRISEIENQFFICNKFTDDMIIRLYLLEDKINPLFERYNYLYQNCNINSETSKENLKWKQMDAFVSIITSILDVRIDLLKLKLNIQNNPSYIESAAKGFVEKINCYQNLWSSIKNDSQRLGSVANDLKDVVNNMNFWQKNIPFWLGGRKRGLEKKIKDFEANSISYKKTFDDEMDMESLIDKGNIIKKELSAVNQSSLIYWRDNLGEHSYYTDDLLIK